MQFRNPEILFALFFLIIPIIVHLFQLQRFKKTPFTNVALLKDIKQQSRKSERLKKWLILASRLTALTFLIFAFSGPELSNSERSKFQNISIILDNSYSMEAKGEKGELLKSTTMELAEYFNSENTDYTLITNNNISENLDAETLKDVLISTGYSPNSFDFNASLMKINDKNIDSINNLGNTILITDFQNNTSFKNDLFTNVNRPISMLKLSPVNKQNYFIDSVFIKEKNSSQIKLAVTLEAVENTPEILPVSLFDNDKLIGKASAYFSDSKSSEVIFTLPASNAVYGKIKIDDGLLNFDNEFYFVISNPEKRRVLSIGKNSNYLAAIYRAEEFEFIQFAPENIDFSTLARQDVVLLNELPEIPAELIPELVTFTKNGGDLIVIPSGNSEILGYNSLFRQLGPGQISEVNYGERQISKIHFDHPILTDVFENRITNFQYPSTNQYYNINIPGTIPILSFDNGRIFSGSVKANEGILYWLSAPISIENSSFYSSPLVVPLFYNMGKHGADLGKMYYTIGESEQVQINTELQKEEVLRIENNMEEVIPEQILLNDKVRLTLGDNLSKQGFYTIRTKDKNIRTIALNLNRDESYLAYLAYNSVDKTDSNVNFYENLDSLFYEFDQAGKMNVLFKLFLILSILFLFIEMLILKFFKQV